MPACCRTRMRSSFLTKPPTRPWLTGAVMMALILRAPQVMAASFEPGAPADPPTGAVPLAQPPATPTADGIRWEFAPVSHSGSVSIDGRWLDLGNGVRTTQLQNVGDIEFGTYLWQPWFVQVRAGLGFVLARDTTREAGASVRTTTNPAATGRLAISVFPVSRFPFEMRAEVTDSRVQGDTLGTGFRAHRFSLSQSYAPPVGNENYNLHLDHSRRTTIDGISDTVTSLSATAARHWEWNQLNLSAQFIANRRSDTGESAQNIALALHHNHSQPNSFQVDSLASWNRARLETAGQAPGFSASTDIRQISSFVTWRPREGEWLYSGNSAVSLSGSARLVEFEGTGPGAGRGQRLINASLGINQDLSEALRLSGSASTTLIHLREGGRRHFHAMNAAANYSPRIAAVGEWHYSPAMAGNAGVTRSSENGTRQTLGVQASHSISRPYQLGENDSLSLSLVQSLGVSHESSAAAWARQLTHSASLSWQGQGSDSSQSYASFSISDSRNLAPQKSSFQLANLQISRRTQLSRDASWSGNLTVQSSRSHTSALESTPDLVGPDVVGAQIFYGGSLSYENRRVWGVPRLRFTALLDLNSQQLESRALGDIDAPRERVTKSLEGRFDYAVGRLETRLTTRLVEADGRRIASTFLRLQRRF